MGKPSSYQHPKNSNHSLNSSITHQRIQSSMSNHKMERKMRKTHNKTKKNIKNLFETLKRQSTSSLDSSHNQTVISLDKSDANITVINKNSSNYAGQKRKIDSTINESTKRRKSNNSLIIIPDDDTITNTAPCPLDSPRRKNIRINCSTPINKRDSKSLKNMIINNFPCSNNISTQNVQNVSEDIINLTKEIHRDSYLTIDLTTNSENKTNNTVIDLDSTVDNSTQMSDCTVVSVSNDNLSMSGDSDVTILQNRKRTSKNLTKGISKLNSKDKGKLLELLAQKIFNGCKIPSDVKETLSNIRLQAPTQGLKTEQDMFIKEVILGESKSRNSIGSNIYHPSKDDKNKKGLRMVVIDGSNVAMEHTKGSMFSVKGLKICIEYFVRRGHVVKAFVPRFRCKYGKSSDPRLLDELERQGLVVYTPSREIQGRMCVPYDDRYIVQCAAEFDGVIVSGDNYRDLLKENPRWRFVIENRLLPFTWVNDMIMFPRDPLGRNGPTLEEFLRHPVNTGPTIIL